MRNCFRGLSPPVETTCNATCRACAVYHEMMRAFLPLALLLSSGLQAQIIPFESNGLRYQALTKGGVTVMYAALPARLKDYAIIQVSISNGSPVPWVMKAEDFGYRKQDGETLQASPALTVVISLLNKASRHDVIKLVTTYENSVFGNVNMQTTNGFESRREAALADGVSTRIKAGAA